ncbi:hypothetical protein ACS5NO_20665 [Larkinella sp. GY13]|uniref:hypothetical protein n=1 Tax=Larkinella sp. GY13 TaxID=3453720 RepID=UPI003EEBF7ED
METLEVETEKVQKTEPVIARFSRWRDGQGQLFLVLYKVGGFDAGGTWRVSQIGLLNIDTEVPQEVSLAQFRDWVETGTLKRFTGIVAM